LGSSFWAAEGCYSLPAIERGPTAAGWPDRGGGRGGAPIADRPVGDGGWTGARVEEEMATDGGGGGGRWWRRWWEGDRRGRARVPLKLRAGWRPPAPVGGGGGAERRVVDGGSQR